MSEPCQYYLRGSGLIVHGIDIDSRHNQARDLEEMITFCRAAESTGVAHLIKSVWYDSNGAHAEIEPSAAFHAMDEIPRWAAAECIRQTAQETLLCFVFLGEMGWSTELQQELQKHDSGSKRHLRLVPRSGYPRRIH